MITTPTATQVVAGIVPVIVIDDAGAAVDLAHSLADGGLRCAENTLRTEAGLDSIRRMAAVPDFVVGRARS